MGCFNRLGGVVIGLIFVVVGLLFAVAVPGLIGGEITRFEALQPSNAVALRAAAIGSDLLIEGTLAADNPAVFRNFVAYEREEYRGRDSDGDAEWVADAGETPALIIEAGGAVQLAAFYDIEGAHETWQDREQLEYNGRQGTQRYHGLVAGGTVTAVGTVVVEGDLRALRADLVYAGTREALLGDRRTAQLIVRVMGGIFVIVGLIAAVGSLLRR
jgi:hypothetical protein